jgi:antibiotic biosynthesis monooxygenase (ABM) superfamily enzyme
VPSTRSRSRSAWPTSTREAVNDAVTAFAGYLGNDIAPGDDGEWTVIYRFDSKPHLMEWLASPERAEVLSRGLHLFDGPADLGGHAGRDPRPEVLARARPSDQQDTPRFHRAAASVSFLAIAALVFWLCTTQIWHLP